MRQACVALLTGKAHMPQFKCFNKANSLAPPPPPIFYHTDTAASPQTTAVLAANPASAPVPVAAPSTNATTLNATTLNIPAAGRAE